MFHSSRIKSSLSILIILNLLLASSTSYAQWWNPLAPKDYDDCVIKNLKSGMGEDAVRALQYSCMQKYPPKSTAAETIAEKKVDEKYKKCGLDREHYKNHMFFALGSRSSYITSEIISKIKTFKYDGSTNKVGFQNMNSFGISGVMVGFTTNKQCPQTTEEYQYSTYCSSHSTESGVAPSAYGSLSCGQLPKEAKAMGFCPIGYSPMYNKFNESLLDFKENNNYCN
jgi:hypothetical protein